MAFCNPKLEIIRPTLNTRPTDLSMIGVVKLLYFFSTIRFVYDLWHGTPLASSVMPWVMHSQRFIGNHSFSSNNVATLQLRNIHFWARAAQIYSSYKWFQLTDAIQNRSSELAIFHKLNIVSSRLTSRNERLSALHEENSARIMRLCLDLRGFYLKSGQFLGTRHDFMPKQFTSKLSTLHDNVPALDRKTVQELIEKELKGPIDRYFYSLDLDGPVGSASIGQVHKGVWRGTPSHKQLVAVKVQNPDAERLMISDLRNLRLMAMFLANRRELPFDLLSVVEELQSQILFEFDFRNEAMNMETVGQKLVKIVSGVEVPVPIFSTKKLLVMSFLNGESISKLKHKQILNSGSSLDVGWRRWLKAPRTDQLIKRRLLKKLAEAWAIQIFSLCAFHADPHPGNICIVPTTGVIGLFDWGQVKHISSTLRRKLANLIVEIVDGDFERTVNADITRQSVRRKRITRAFLDLDIKVHNETDFEGIEKMALTMFDTRIIGQYADLNPLNNRSALRRNAIISMPRELFFLLRTIQIMKGYSIAFDLKDFSIATEWYRYAMKISSPA